MLLFNRIFRIANYSNESSYSQVWQSMSVIPALRKQKLGKLGFEASLGYTQQKQRQGEEGDLCYLVVSKILFVFSLFGILSYCIYSYLLLFVFMCACAHILCVGLTVLGFAVQTRLALNSVLPLPLKCWVQRHVPPCLACLTLFLRNIQWLTLNVIFYPLPQFLNV